ncbi:MAG: GDYXXLXY domain-containing protein [Chitinophagaceae bacterium]
MIKVIVWPAFILMVFIQWWIPGQMIWNKEKVLSKGKLYKFQSAPVDPNDPFRGKYIVLNFRENSLKLPAGTTTTYGQKVFVRFFKDAHDFAKIASISYEKPQGTDYLETTIDYTRNGEDSNLVFIKYPFDNYYMDEYKAPEAERIYTERIIDSTQRTYALVSILSGNAVIKDVFINDTSIHQIIRGMNR